MTDRVKRDRVRSTAKEPDSVLGVVENWLAGDLDEADTVRAAVARRLAVELDGPDVPPYVVARIATALVAVVDAIETDEEDRRERLSKGELVELLRDVAA